jgi:hypothetical protein
MQVVRELNWLWVGVLLCLIDAKGGKAEHEHARNDHGNPPHGAHHPFKKTFDHAVSCDRLISQSESFNRRNSI